MNLNRQSNFSSVVPCEYLSPWSRVHVRGTSQGTLAYRYLRCLGLDINDRLERYQSSCVDTNVEYLAAMAEPWAPRDNEDSGS
jgi:hypothetical protein